MTRPRRGSAAGAAPSPGPRAARPRERFREFAPPELIDVEPPGEDADEVDPDARPEYPRLVRPPECASESAT